VTDLYDQLIRLLIICSIASLLTLPGTVSGADRDGARFSKLMKQGKGFVDQREYGTALALFEEAFRTNPASKGAVFNMGYCLMRLERQEEALGKFQAYMAMNPGPAKLKKARLFATRIEEKLSAEKARVELTSIPSEATVQIEGEAERLEQRTPVTLWLNPGEHILVLNSPGYETTQKRLTVVAGEVLNESLSMTLAAPRPAIGIDVKPDQSQGYAGPWTVVGAGGAAMTTGVVLVALAWRDYGKYEESHDSTQHDRAKDKELAGWLLAGTGAAALAGGVIWRIAAGTDSPAPDRAFFLTPTPDGAMTGFSATF
jgi:tetratricopeptide (TPR) repeat protein